MGARRAGIEAHGFPELGDRLGDSARFEIAEAQVGVKAGVRRRGFERFLDARNVLAQHLRGVVAVEHRPIASDSA